MTGRFKFTDQLISDDGFWEETPAVSGTQGAVTHGRTPSRDHGLGQPPEEFNEPRTVRLVPLEAAEILAAWNASVLPGMVPPPLDVETITLLAGGEPTSNQLKLKGTEINNGYY